MRTSLCTVGLVLLAIAPATQAALGGDATSVADDRIRMKAVVREATQPDAQAYLTPAGTLVREYASADGRVYAITWDGPFMPDLRQLLGEHWQTYLDGAATASRGLSSLDLSKGALRMKASGRLHAFRGRAWLPDLVPPGVNVDALP
jgi:hypothetical protein